MPDTPRPEALAAEFEQHPLLNLRLKDFSFHYGQPPEVRQAFVEAMGIGGP